jgi:hypothetical protein
MPKLRFLIQEDNEQPKTLEFLGDYKTKDLEAVYLELINPDTEWFRYKSPPAGFIVRKKDIKSVNLLEGQ